MLATKVLGRCHFNIREGPRDEVHAMMLSHAQKALQRGQITVCLGRRGNGKTTEIASYCETHRRSGVYSMVATHFVGMREDSRNPMHLIQSLCKQLETSILDDPREETQIVVELEERR